jgi:hypothetical protein
LVPEYTARASGESIEFELGLELGRSETTGFEFESEFEFDD